MWKPSEHSDELASLHISAARADTVILLSLALGRRISRADHVSLATGRRTSCCFSDAGERRCNVRQVAVRGFTNHGVPDLAKGRLLDSGPRSALALRWGWDRFMDVGAPTIATVFNGIGSSDGNPLNSTSIFGRCRCQPADRYRGKLMVSRKFTWVANFNPS